MIRGIALLLLLPVVSASLIAQDMIADIREPIQTEFGTYVPYIVNASANVIPYTVAPDFSNVANFKDFIKFFDDRELMLLQQNLFVATPRQITDSTDFTSYKEMYDIYNECREKNIPILVTTDAVLHTFHLMFDKILKTVEEKRFFSELDALLKNLLTETNHQDDLTGNPTVKAALRRNFQFLAIAASLLDSTYEADPFDSIIQHELDLIRAHTEMEFQSPLFGYTEDYTQYLPRGHYTDSDSLKSYFRAMMWLGRMTFPIDTKWSLSAILLLHALANTAVVGQTGQDMWEKIYWPTVFMVGKTDDIDLDMYQPIIKRVYGDNYHGLTSDDFVDSSMLAEFISEAEKLPDPKIGDGLDKPKGFRFMGQRFIPDSWVFDQLVYLNIPCRFWPQGLDAMTVLGSHRAYELLDTWYNEFTSCPDYKKRLDELQSEFAAYQPKTWVQNLYWNWLYCLMPILMEKGEGWPAFMRSAAWRDKDLLACLGSWAELRHDTILYAKQSGTERGHFSSSCSVQGYVEPNAYFYARLAALANYVIMGLTEWHLLFDDFKVHLHDIQDLLLSLKRISEKEMSNSSLSSTEYSLICNIGTRLQALATFADAMLTETPGNQTEPMPVIADVHSEYNSGKVLEVGVGYPYSIYAIVPIEGQLKIAKGAIFSYYEFNNDARLTDEEWRVLLSSSNPPADPEWTGNFVSETFTKNSNPGSYQWEKQGLVSLVVTLNTDTLMIGENVEVLIKAYNNTPAITMKLVEPPIVTLYPPAGKPETITEVTRGIDNYTAIISTRERPAGHYWMTITAKPETIRNSSIQYRTGFFLSSTTSATPRTSVLPRAFALHQNHPNPFNPGTTIMFDLPITSRIEISIFNMLGQRIRKLINAYAGCGSHTIQWDGQDDLGTRVAGGIYYCRLQAFAKDGTAFEGIIKMILMR